MIITEFNVCGKPITQGSKRAISKGYMRDTSDEATKHQPANRLRDWKANIEGAALLAMMGLPYDIERGPVNVSAQFVFERHPSSWLKSGGIKKGSPTIPRGDLDKLFRAIGDAMSGIVYKDDNQIVSWDGSYKRFAEPNESAGVYIVVSRGVGASV